MGRASEGGGVRMTPSSSVKRVSKTTKHTSGNNIVKQLGKYVGDVVRFGSGRESAATTPVLPSHPAFYILFVALSAPHRGDCFGRRRGSPSHCPLKITSHHFVRGRSTFGTRGGHVYNRGTYVVRNNRKYYRPCIGRNYTLCTYL